MIKKQSYIINSTLKRNNLNNYSSRNLLSNDQRLGYIDDDRYLISDYIQTNNLGKFFKTKYSDFFGFLGIPVQYRDEYF